MSLESSAPQAILITGATSGIGRALAVKLAHLGYCVIVNGRDIEACQQLAQSLSGLALAFDVTQENEVAAAFKQLNSTLKAKQLMLAGLAHCAGSLLTLPLHFTNSAAMQQMFLEHVQASILLAQWGSRFMIREKYGAMVFVSSIVAQQGSVGHIAYASAKAAVEGAVKSLAKELAPQGIRVNGVAPGVIATPLIRDFDMQQRQQFMNNSLIGRLGTPEDVANAIAFLLSDESAFITGQILAVDGGLRL